MTRQGRTAWTAPTWARAAANPLTGGVFVLAVIVALITQTQSSLTVFTMNTVMLAAIGAIALNILMGTAGQASIGNAAFLAIGAYGAVFFMRVGVGFPFDVILAALASGLIGVVVGLPALRLHGVYLILATLAAYFIVIYVVTQYQTDTAGAGGFIFAQAFADKGYSGAQNYWAWTLFGVLTLTVLIAICLVHGRTGRALRMIREHELAAPTMGIRPTRLKLLAFAASSVLIGGEGALTAHFTGSVISDSFTVLLAIQYIVMILIGGMDSILGGIVGAALVTCLPVYLPDVVGHFVGAESALTIGPNVALITYGVLITLFVVFAPRGIAGWLRSGRDLAAARGLGLSRKARSTT